MATLGIIGSGNIGAAVARLAVAGGMSVVVANSRGPQSLADLIAELGPLATAGTVEQAAVAGDLVVLSVPLTAHTAVTPLSTQPVTTSAAAAAVISATATSGRSRLRAASRTPRSQ